MEDISCAARISSVQHDFCRLGQLGQDVMIACTAYGSMHDSLSLCTGKKVSSDYCVNGHPVLKLRQFEPAF